MIRPYKSIGGACLCLIALGVPCSSSHRPAPAFINNVLSVKTRSCNTGNDLQMTKEADEALCEAEDAAALDAHDLSDPGVEGAAMERAVMMAAEFEDQHPHKEIHPTNEVENKPSKTSFLGKIRSFFRHEDNNEEESDADLLEVTDAEAKNKGKKGRVLEAMEAEATYAHDLSDTAAMEHADEILLDENTNKERGKKGRVFEAMEAEATYAHDLSDTAAMEHVLMSAANDDDESTALMTPAQLKSKCLEVLNSLQTHEHVWVFNAPVDPIELGLDDYFDIIKHPMDLGTVKKKLKSGRYHTLNDFQSDVELTFDNAMKYNKDHTVVHVMARELKKKFETDFQKITKQDTTDDDDEPNLNAKEAAAAYVHELESYVHDLSDAAALGALPKEADEAHITSVEDHFKSIEKEIKTIEHLIEEVDSVDRTKGHSLERLMMMEKFVDAAADKLELSQKRAQQTENEVKIALEEKYSAKALAEYSERKLEEAIEHDIAAKRELEKMADNKSVLKQELRELEDVIHERTRELWKKEDAKKEKAKKAHHFDWWPKRW